MMYSVLKPRGLGVLVTSPPVIPATSLTVSGSLANDYHPQFEFYVRAVPQAELCSQLRLTVASRHCLLPGKNGPLHYYATRKNRLRDEKSRLGEDEMVWCRKGKFQIDPSTVHAQRLAYPVPSFSRATEQRYAVGEGGTP